MNNPSKKHSAKRDNRSEGQPTFNIGVRGTVSEGTHVPGVQLQIGDVRATLSVNDGIDLATSLIQSATMAYQDALLLRFFQATGQPALQAFQSMITFQQFRQHDLEMRMQIDQAAQQPQQPQEPAPPGPAVETPLPGGDEPQ